MQSITVFHADSLTGPMQKLKAAFERKNQGIEIRLYAGRSKELATQIMEGKTCDVFAPSDPDVIRVLMERGTAYWFIVFSQNEMVVITKKGNPRAIKGVEDLLEKNIQLVCVAGEKDLATGRTIEFIRNIVGVHTDTNLLENCMKVNTIPEALVNVKNGQADAGIVYLSAAVSEQDHLEWISFPSDQNLSKKIRNAVTIPSTALNPRDATLFLQFIQSQDGQDILRLTGQPPVIPVIKEGVPPMELM